MSALGKGATLASLAVLAACSGPSASPPACEPIAPLAAVSDAGLPADTVWGFADLHSHPAIERAFGGRMVWGTALDDAPVNANELPEIGSCPVETHDPNASTPLDHNIGSIVFPHVAQVASYAHGPVGDLTYRPSTAWPNARDVIHQQMNIASIRRAYEGGLRLMFAAPTDNQVLGALLKGPNFLNGFVPDPAADYESARSQLVMIDQIVEKNSTWMGIARTPKDARTLIHAGKLALVLSLEMDGLRPGDAESLMRDFGVRHIIPIHLIDNDIGGTAATSPLFNDATAAVSQIYRADQQPQSFINLAPTTTYGPSLDWPGEIVTLPGAPLFVFLNQIQYPRYSDLCYEPLGYCAVPTAARSSFIEVGQENLKGLCNTSDQCALQPHPGKARLQELMHDQLILDVSHMSDRAVNDTLTVTPPSTDPVAPGGYPLIASHGDISHLCDSAGAPADCFDTSPGAGNERSLRGDYARALIDRGGVLGLGSGTGVYGGRTVLEARGGPLLSLAPSGPTAGCVARPAATGAATPDCTPIADPNGADLDATVDTLIVQTLGGVDLDYARPSPNSRPFVRVELDPPQSNRFQHRVILEPLDCSSSECTATVNLGTQDDAVTVDDAGNVHPVGGAAPFSIGACTELDCAKAGVCGSTPYTIDHVDSVQVEWKNLACDLACQQSSGTTGQDLQCGSSNAPEWTVDQASVIAMSNGVATPLITLGPRSDRPVAVLDGSRGGLTLYNRGDRPAVGASVPATGHLLKIAIKASSNLLGATSDEAGANVCVAVRQEVGGVCAPLPRPGAGATECPSGWVSMNQRGAWASGTQLFTFARFAGAESSVCGVDVAVLDWDPTNGPWTLDEINVQAIEDPVGRWVRRYADVSKYVAKSQMGRLAFGTDFNGLNGLTDISELPVPAGAVNASFCPVDGDADAGDADAGDAGAVTPALLAPMRLRHADGSLGSEVLIEERGLATYGLLADMVNLVAAYPGCGQDVYDSLMLSAEATIRAWEAIVDPHAAPRHKLPTAAFKCGAVPRLAP